MKTKLNVAIVQTDIISDDISANLANYEELFWDISEDTDLIVLPEAFNTGFDVKKTNIEPVNLHTFKWLKQMAKLKQAFIIGSYFVQDKSNTVNRLYCVAPDGTTQFYDKYHLFTFSEEGEKCTRGTTPIDFDVYGWKIRASVCFDMRFPVFLRNTTDYDILVNVANWPAPRIEQYKTLAKARAIENQCYTITANRIGIDQLQIEYNGQSCVYNYKGEELKTPSSKEEIITITLSKEELEKARKEFPVLTERDLFEIKKPL